MVKPCVKCGSTDRYKGGDCVRCSKEYQKRYYLAHKAKSASYKSEWLAKNPESAKEFDLQVRTKRYGMTPSQYRELLSKQDGRCAICTRPMDRIDIDHNHDTGKVRGLLCHACNIGLGAFRDSPQLLLQAVKYLRKDSQTGVVGEKEPCTTI